MDQKVELRFRREVNSELDASGIRHPASGIPHPA